MERNEANKVRLRFQGVNEIVGNEEMGIITLTDEQRERMISIVCDKTMAVQLELRVRQVPVTHIMLPEVLTTFIKQQMGFDFEILIHNIVDGQYRVLLCNNTTLEAHPMRASDAVLLSVVADVPIFMEQTLMERQSQPYSAQARGVALPVNTLSSEMLEAALKRAVEEENYELASQLRDEKNRRKEK